MGKCINKMKDIALGVGAGATIKNWDEIQSEIEGIEKILNELMEELDIEEEDIIDMKDLMREISFRKERIGREALYRHLGKEIVFTGSWRDRLEERELEESELFPGEMNATVVTVGCYRVRIADRIYHGVRMEVSDPLKKSGTDLAEELIKMESGITAFNMKDADITSVCEISAEHIKDKKGFQLICRVDTTSYTSWWEQIIYVGTVKANEQTEDEQASLFVCVLSMGDSYYTYNWYKMTPDGTISEYQEHPYADGYEEPWEIN